jgi:hypothetical protein
MDSSLGRSRHKPSGERTPVVAITCLQWDRDGGLAEPDREGMLSLLARNLPLNPSRLASPLPRLEKPTTRQAVPMATKK